MGAGHPLGYSDYTGEVFPSPHATLLDVDLGLIKSRIPLGSTIRLQLKSGSEHEGELLDIDEACLVISTERSELLLEAEAITSIERLGARSPAVPAAAAAVMATTVPTAVPVGPKPVERLSAPGRPLVLPAAAEAALQRLATAAAQLSQQIPRPVFAVRTDDLDPTTAAHLAKLLHSIRSRYEYAIRVRESAKVLECVAHLSQLAVKYDRPEAFQMAGRMAWLLGKQERALELLAEAADRLDDSSSCFDLGVAQRLSSERSFAAGTFASAVHEGTDASDPVLLALIATVAEDGEGREEVVALVRNAAAWAPGPGRLAVLHAGLLFADRSRLSGFPAAEWASSDIAAAAVVLVAEAVEGSGTAPAPGVRRPTAVPVPRPSTERRVASGGPTPAALDSPLSTPLTASTPEGQIAELAAQARRHLAAGQLTEATAALRRMRSLADAHDETWAVEREVAQLRARAAGPVLVGSFSTRPQPMSAISSPRVASDVRPQGEGRSLHVRAEDAERRRNYAEARDLWLRAIEENDDPRRAVRRLAIVLTTGLKVYEEAVALLDRHGALFTTRQDLNRWSQLRSTALEHWGKWDDAADELRDMLARQPSGEERSRIITRLVVALTKTFKIGEAERLVEDELRKHPTQASVKKLRADLQQARVSGVYDKIGATLQLHAEQASELSPLLTFHLDKCEYRGVRADRVKSRTFDEDDIKRLDELVSGRSKNRVLGSDTPRDRADYNLSAARIMHDLGITDERLRSRLRYFAAAMGDTCAGRGTMPRDVIRGYYAEAVSVKSGWDDLVDVKLRQLVLSFTRPEALLDFHQFGQLEDVLTTAMKADHLVVPVLTALISLPTHGEVGSRLVQRIWQNRETRERFSTALRSYLNNTVSVADKEGFTRAWIAAAEQARARREGIARQIGVLTDRMKVDLVEFNQHRSELERIAQEMGENSTDRNRIQECLKLVSEVSHYVEQTVYVERERLSGSVLRGIQTVIDEIERAPTVMSLKVLRPYLEALDKRLSEHFTNYREQAEPDSLGVELVVDRYLPDSGRVDVQLDVSNAEDASPVSNVAINVLPSDDYSAAHDPIPVAASIAAGESRTCAFTLFPSRTALGQQLITLRCRVSFTSRSEQQVSALVEPKSIRLHQEVEWVDIPNPYTAGPVVKQAEMFVGRDRLIANLAETVTGEDVGSVVVYGQKRAGKSSVLYHLEKELVLPTLAVEFSMLDLAGSVTYADFLHQIGQACRNRFEDLIEEQDLRVEPPPEPDLVELRLSPLPKFFEHMRRFERWRRRIPELSGVQIVLLIDEFSVIHKHIRTGDITDEFMKGWKAMLEAGFFRCVLVGNDLMPRFIADFPNEFQVARQERVSYLDRRSAVRLIEEPIALPDGASRYQGNAVERILELTGRSAYYIQLFCQRLVQYMNSADVRGPIIGPADVEAVADLLIRGQSLQENEFDNLLTPGDKEVTDISPELVKQVLRDTARDRGRSMYHEIDGRCGPDAEAVLHDLVGRQVLERIRGDRYRIQVGLFSEWLQHQWA